MTPLRSAAFAALVLAALAGAVSSRAAHVTPAAGKPGAGRAHHRRVSSRTRSAAKRAAAGSPAARNASGAAMRVAIDPATGAPTRPSPEQARALAEESGLTIKRPLLPLTEVRLPDGTRLVKMDDRLMQYVVARRDSNGAIQIGCVSGTDRARRAIQAPAAPRRQVSE